jgi:branched-chain amino acid transport system ATP-binding protein
MAQAQPVASPSTGTEPLLAARDLSCGYHGHPVVRDLDFEVRAGEVVALLGPNGAGKTTTLSTLAGELRPIKGTVELHGSATTSPLYRRVRGGLGFVTERRSVFSQLSVAENLRVGRCDTEEALELFPELRALLHRRGGLLSGGEQQMLTLARALARKPSVLLADELSLGLAPLVVTRLLTAVRTAATERGVGVLLVEQHVSQALRIADYVLVMRNGSIVLRGTVSEVEHRLEEAYLTAAGGITESPAPAE